MPPARHRLFQAIVVAGASLGVSGCYLSHERTSGEDAGRLADASAVPDASSPPDTGPPRDAGPDACAGLSLAECCSSTANAELCSECGIGGCIL